MPSVMNTYTVKPEQSWCRSWWMSALRRWSRTCTPITATAPAASSRAR
jgi:hypothetical protein